MLKILTLLSPFFEDVYSEISIREYGRLSGISPPSAAKQLREFEKESLIFSQKRGIYIYYKANTEQFLFKELSKMYWYSLLFPLTEKLHANVMYRNVVLFGSIVKSENTKNSDIDLYLDTSPKKIELESLQKKLHRKIELHFINAKKNEHLKKNIERGIIIR